MYKTETHIHTKPVSACAFFSPEEMVHFHKKAGYNTIFISDHFSKHHFGLLGDIPWSEKTGLLYNSFLRAKAEGEKLGINVLFSPELTLQGNHFLLYNVTPELLNSREDFFDISLKELRSYTKKYGVTIIQAHPFRDNKCVPMPEYVDGFEAINSNSRHENYDERVFMLAKKHNLPVSAGSDAHRREDVGGAAVLSPYEIRTTDDYLRLLKSKDIKLVKYINQL